jgi:hypothetical protein
VAKSGALSTNFAESFSMTTGPIRFGFEAKGQRVADCTLVHFGELWPAIRKSYASRQLETSAEVPTRVPHVPRPLFGLTVSTVRGVLALCRPTSRSRYSMTTWTDSVRV